MVYGTAMGQLMGFRKGHLEETGISLSVSFVICFQHGRLGEGRLRRWLLAGFCTNNAIILASRAGGGA